MDLDRRWAAHCINFREKMLKLQKESEAKKALEKPVVSAMDTSDEGKSIPMPATETVLPALQVAIVDGKAVVTEAKPWPNLEVKIPPREVKSPALQSATPTPVNSGSPEVIDYKAMSISDAESTTKFKSQRDDELPPPPAKRTKIDEEWHEMSVDDFSDEKKEEKV